MMRMTGFLLFCQKASKKNLDSFTRFFYIAQEKTQLLLVGGKGLHLGELSKILGIQVPEGFCVTTAGYQKVIEQNEAYHALLHQLTMLQAEDRDQIREISRNDSCTHAEGWRKVIRRCDK